MSGDKHVNWFALEKACGKSGCPVCSIVAERSERYIDNMLFEHVSDRGFRAKFREAGGFCAAHAKNLDTFRDGLAVAILSADVLGDRLPDIARGKVKKPKGVCPACAETERVETEFLGFIAEATDELFISIFTASDGLCVPHYVKMLGTVKKVPRWLSGFQIGRYESLLERSKQFIECSAWGRQDDFAALSDTDKVVWKEIALALRGTAGSNLL
jgi:hypothetical protein